MRIALGLLVLAAGCEKTDPLFCEMNPGATGCEGAGDGGNVDGVVDGEPGIDARSCFGAGDYEVCLAPSQIPTMQFTWGTAGTFDTGTGNTGCLATQPASWAAAGQPDACFVVATAVAISANMAVSGTRPLVLLGTETVTITAEIDVASHAGKAGPGAPAQSGCPAFTITPADNDNGGGGGAGASFMSQGGPGGDGNAGNSPNGAAGAPLANPPLRLRAGCSGQDGGTGHGSAGQGIGGVGGGALYVVAGTSITLLAGSIINASGQGGTRAGRQGGGGGGGSGGMIVLHAPAITSSGSIVLANGGGGSSGGDDTGATNGGGEAGEDQDADDPSSAPEGGAGTDNAGNGGDGYYEANSTVNEAKNGTPGMGNRGGGAGGGAKGYIQSNIALTGVTSPSPVIQ